VPVPTASPTPDPQAETLPDATPDEAARILADLAAALDRPAPPIECPFSLTRPIAKPRKRTTGGLFEQE
jgi:hypothetical protein